MEGEGPPSLTPSEVEFLAEDELISIVPQFKQPELRFIQVPGPRRARVCRDDQLRTATNTHPPAARVLAAAVVGAAVRGSLTAPVLSQGEFGPFRPQMSVDVPLWLAMQMKKACRCRIRPPKWMEQGPTDSPPCAAPPLRRRCRTHVLRRGSG